MNLKQFKEKLFSRGSKAGFSDMELFKNTSKSFDLRVFEQEIDHYSINEDQGVSFRGLYDGKMGYAYTEKLEEDSLDMLLKKARENAQIMDKKEEVIHSGSDNYRKVNYFNESLQKITPEEKIDLIKSLEKYALEKDKRVETVNHCIYSDLEFETGISNSLGLDLSFENNVSYLYLSVVVREKDEVRTANKFDITQDFTRFNPEKLAEEAVNEAISLIGAKTLSSNTYPIILRRDVAAKILSAFSSTFSAERVQKGLSLFKGKLNEKVADSRVTIIDDPFFEKGFNSSPFDGEGVATRKKEVIKNGCLTTYLHNLKTASKAGTESTGNAYRSSHKSAVGISPTNMYIKPGKHSYQDIINSIEKGIIITEVQGLHSGANSISGDFSLGAFGYYVEKGEIIRPVEQITISGNFLSLLKNVEMVGSDFKMDLPGSGHFGSPSIKIKELDVAGE